MTQLVVFSLLISTLAINATPLTKDTPTNHAAEARRLVHHTNWASVATTSKIDSTEWPMVNLLPTADIESTGEIYFYMMPLDMVARDTTDDKRITLMFTDAQEGECNRKGFDPWSHKCAKTMISGKIQEVEKGSDEHTRGLETFHSRHPTAHNWKTPPPPNPPHDFYLCKLEISNIIVFGPGGYHHPTTAEYFAGTDSVDVKED